MGFFTGAIALTTNRIITNIDRPSLTAIALTTNRIIPKSDRPQKAIALPHPKTQSRFTSIFNIPNP